MDDQSKKKEVHDCLSCRLSSGLSLGIIGPVLLWIGQDYHGWHKRAVNLLGVGLLGLGIVRLYGYKPLEKKIGEVFSKIPLSDYHIRSEEKKDD